MRHLYLPLEMDARLEASLRESGVPPNLHDGLLRYLRQGILPGSFLRAVLRNDLAGAARRADPFTGRCLPAIVAWLDLFAPANAWGDAEAPERWCGWIRSLTPSRKAENP